MLINCKGNEFDLREKAQLISIWMVVHQDSLWKWGMQQLGNRLFNGETLAEYNIGDNDIPGNRPTTRKLQVAFSHHFVYLMAFFSLLVVKSPFHKSIWDLSLSCCLWKVSFYKFNWKKNDIITDSNFQFSPN